MSQYYEIIIEIEDGRVRAMHEKICRCRDCQHWKPIGDGIFGECHNGCHDQNWFCADGEREE